MLGKFLDTILDFTLAKTTDRRRAEDSRFRWGEWVPEHRAELPPPPNVYKLRLRGVLPKRWFI